LILLDVNVVLAAHRVDHSHYGVVGPWLDRKLESDEQVAVPDIVWASFIRLATNRRVFEQPTPTEDAFAFLRAVRSHPNHVTVVPGEHHLSAFEDLCLRFDAKGELAADAYLAAIAIEQGCSVASLDRDFSRFTDVDWVVPG
jgi:hypothetical protein